MRHVAVIVALGITQIIGYGTLYYSFAILAPAMAADLGWPVEWTFAALSVSLLAGGLAAPPTGRLIDRHGAGRVMAAGSVIAALALALCTIAPVGAVFVAALILIEVAGTLVLYGAAFSLLVQRDPEGAQRHIVWLTLIAGFASTIFWPLTTALHAVLDWRQVYLVFALAHVGLCLPLHLWLGRSVAAGAARVADVPRAAPKAGALPLSDRRAGFALMAGGFALQSFVLSAVLVHMLPLLAAAGLGAAGVAVATLFGPAQVASRLINMIFGRRLTAPGLAITSAMLLPAGLAMLLLWPQVGGAMVFAMLFGMGSGLNSIVMGTLPLHLFGSTGYGALQGRISAVRLVVASAAPFALALLLERAGLGPTLGMALLLGVAAVACFAVLARLAARD